MDFGFASSGRAAAMEIPDLLQAAAPLPGKS
jgi:hypothetical protein